MREPPPGVVVMSGNGGEDDLDFGLGLERGYGKIGRERVMRV